MATIAQVKAGFAANYPGRNWDQLCQAVAFDACEMFGSGVTVYSSANAARSASSIVSTDPLSAPAGAFHYWKIGTYGHVAVALGNGYALMGSSHITDRWGTNLGVTTVKGYTATTGASYVGWSRSNGRNTISISDTYGGGSGSSTNYAFGLTTAAQLAAQQALAKLGLYSGAQDGAFGALSVKAFQTYLKNVGLLPASYVVDGVPGGVYGTAVETLARQHGYTGPLDGAPGAMTSAAIVSWAGTVSAPTTPPDPTQPTTPEPAAPYVAVSLGIDIATGQASIDFAAVKTAGVEFVIVKMGGLNVLPQYVAPNYAAQIDGARAQGFSIGHYYLIGAGQTPTQQADYFVSNLHDFNVEHDVLALDNEPLDANKAQWNDDQVAEFFTEVMTKTGIPASRLWHYSSANQFRSLAPWTKTEAMGVKVWWASYGANPTIPVADHVPDLQGAVKDWTVHQFSSVNVIAGKNVDVNASRSTVADLFATGVVTKPTIPADPDNSTTPTVPSWFTQFIQQLIAFLQGLFGGKKS